MRTGNRFLLRRTRESNSHRFYPEHLSRMPLQTNIRLFSISLSVRRVTIPLPFAYQTNALPIELRTVIGVYRYLLITSNGPLLGNFVGKEGVEPSNLQFQVLVFTDVTLYFTIISEEIRKSVFEFLPHIYLLLH